MTTPRYYAIDHLRTAMMFVVMLGHPLLPYVSIPRSFKDSSTHFGFDIVAIFLYAFAMQAFFVTAGFAAALLLEKKGIAGLWRNRFSRIFMPLLVAYILMSPLMRGAYDFAKAVVEYDSIAAGWIVFLSAEWIRWSKLYHLWFLLSLLLFTGLAVAGLSLLRRFGLSKPLCAWTVRRLTGYSGILCLAVLAVLTTTPSYILESGSGTHWSMQITLFGYFALGFFLFWHQEIIRSWQSCWRVSFVAAMLVLPLCVWASRARLFDERNIDLVVGMLAGVSNGVLGISMTIALLGWFHLRLNKPIKNAEVMGQASYWVYLIHYPIVVAAAGVVAVLDVPAVIKYVATLAIAIPLIALSYYLLVLRTPLRFAIAGKARPK
ncbi:acyltransferase family protein [Aliiglaciecola sp. CAU 1673]|uniref:acyltransferase family protein n=1 Tax=Aliiglaciecola sp. CAU 1673 TaxID=3032595 RepID=UPI0023DB2D01|nr:acyltransferase family protein [Aliiglaciecola sp. CAU 1673]MDF2177221.1 acyltransferase family protein [Aliiglaciecola sp. CAU 1673]